MAADPAIAHSDADPAFVYNGDSFSGSWNTTDRRRSGTLHVMEAAFFVYALK